MNLRITSYNLQALAQGANGVIETLTRIAPDILGIQEVDMGTARSHGAKQARLLAEALGMQFAFAAAMPYDGGEFGIAILARGELTDVHIERLPHESKEEPRVAVIATCHLPEKGSIRFANTHLAADWHAQNPAALRATQASTLADFLRAEADRFAGPLFLCGDFNCDSSSDAISRLRGVARALHEDIKTYPANAPTEALDHVFFIPKTADPQHDVAVVNVSTDPATTSDHLPLTIDLQVIS